MENDGHDRAAAGQHLTPAEDLAADGQRARQEGRMILLLVSQEDCPFCQQIKEEVLLPMIKGGDHQDTLLIRELFIDFDYQVRDFSGQWVSGNTLARRYGAWMTPSLLFLDLEGRELTKKMIGIQTPEYFYFYLDQSIREALGRLQRRD